MQIRAAIGLVVTFAAGMALVPMSAKALCQQEIYAERGWSDGTNVQVLGRTSSAADADVFSYAAYTNNALFAYLIFTAVANHNRLVIVGDAQTCPITGLPRDMGNIRNIFQQP
jgi:hypothetical protein